MIEFKRIDHIQLNIPPGEEEAGRSFYCGILGFAEIEKPEALKKNGGFWVEAGEIQLHIGVEERPGPSKRHPAFEITDVDTARTYLAGKGVPCRDHTAIPGVKRFSLFDPWNNRIELVEKI